MKHKKLKHGDKIRLTGWNTDNLRTEKDWQRIFKKEGYSFPVETTCYYDEESDKYNIILLCLPGWSVKCFDFELIERSDGSKPVPKSVLDAAPEMLAAAEEMVLFLNEIESVHCFSTPYRKMVSAIKKAKGNEDN